MYFNISEQFNHFTPKIFSETFYTFSEFVTVLTISYNFIFRVQLVWMEHLGSLVRMVTRDKRERVAVAVHTSSCQKMSWPRMVTMFLMTMF